MVTFVLVNVTQRYFLELAFDGTEFHGWQVQKNAHTVQEALNSALAILLRHDVETVGCGRTDTGVHARQLYAHFDTDKILEEKDLKSLNALLPITVVAQRWILVPSGAHSRFDATSRSYEYWIHFKKNPFLINKSCWLQNGQDLDVTKMNQAAQQLLQYQDFSCFSKSHTQTSTNNCKITHAQWETTPYGLKFCITADRFLRNMVRSIVGTLIEIGNSKMSLYDLDVILHSKNRSKAGVSMPACGLYLTSVTYPYL